MSNINFEKFQKWAEDRFNGDVIIHGNEIRINSIFTDDFKHHLWCNPFGGKNCIEDGCYRCFYTDRKGTLIGLVMLVDKCSYREAKELLYNEFNLSELEQKLEDFFSIKPTSKNLNYLTLPEHTDFIFNLKEPFRSYVSNYLKKRKINYDKLMYCYEGNYKNRIIIPYYDKEYNLIYYNSRNIGKTKYLRYLGPPKTIGIGKGDVLFVPNWPKPNSKIYLTEGEFDAITLFKCGLNSAACGGKFLTEKQLVLLNNYTVCISLDSDEAGFDSLITMGKQLNCFATFVRPPKGFKDWNDMYIKLNKEIILEWILKNEKSLDAWTIETLKFNKI